MDFSFLKQLFPVKNLFQKQDDSVLGVDIGSSAIKVVQLRKEKGVAILETYGELALGPYAGVEIGRATQLPVEKLVEALSDLLREANVTTRSTGFSIPFASSLLSLIEMPKVSTAELNKMIPLEARKYIPVPVKEVMLDWLIIPDDDREREKKDEGTEEGQDKQLSLKKIEVLLVAIHNEVLYNYNQIVERVGLENSFFEIEIFSSMRAILEQSLTPVMIIDIGAAKTKAYIVEYGIIRNSHVINKGSQDVTIGIAKSLSMSEAEAEEIKRMQGLASNQDANDITKVALLTLDHIFSEANRVLLNYQIKNNKNVPRAILTGGGAVMKGVDELAKRHLETEIELANPFANIDTPAFLDDVLRQAGPEFAVAVGVALRKLNEQP